MLRKLATVVVVLLALHFVAVLGAAGFAFGTGKLDRAKLAEIVKIVAPPTTAPATRPADVASAPTTRPLLQFDDLLAQQAGRTTSEQVQFLRESFDGMAVQLDRQYRELLDLKRQVDLAQAQLSTERAAVVAREKAITDKEALAKRLAADAGFQRTMEIYDSMSPKQLKDVFAAQDDALVARYLQAMEPRRVANIVKEFKTPQEQTRANALLERLRTGDATPAAAETAANAATPR
ncbi:hypothetical protein EON77_19485 [bacterium]|nr:MAG: hypothetical protein EON77_19485 [bacterium]